MLLARAGLFFIIYHNVVEGLSHPCAPDISNLFIRFFFSFVQLRTYVVIVVSSLYCRFLNAGNSRFSSLHEGDVGRDREIKLDLYNLSYA